MSVTKEHVDNNAAVRKMLTERGIVPENLPPASRHNDIIVSDIIRNYP